MATVCSKCAAHERSFVTAVQPSGKMSTSHVPIVNRVFTPAADEIEYYQGLIAAMADAEKKGIAAVTYKGDMVDEAMVKTAREMLEFARSIGLRT